MALMCLIRLQLHNTLVLRSLKGQHHAVVTVSKLVRVGTHCPDGVPGIACSRTWRLRRTFHSAPFFAELLAVNKHLTNIWNWNSGSFASAFVLVHICFCHLGFLDQTLVHVKNLLAKTIVVAASNVAKLLEGRKAKSMFEALLGRGLQLTTSGSATFSHKALSAFRVVPC